jgi:hypothetical protein
MARTPGIILPGELAVSQQSSPNMSVQVGPGRAKVAGSQITPPSGLLFTTQGMYDVLNDAPVTLTVSAADPTNPRIDTVYVQVQDSFYAGSVDQVVLGIATGLAAASPTPPNLPSNALALANVAVAANTTTIVTANISQNALYVGPVGGFLFAGTQALLNTVTSVNIGDHATVFADSSVANNGDYVWTGTAWRLATGDTGWVAMTPASGVTLSANAAARILNQILYFRGSATRSATWSTGQNIATLPSAFLPQITSLSAGFIGLFGSGNLGLFGLSNSSGTVTLNTIVGTASETLGMDYPGPIN